MSVKGKRLLVLGGTASSVDVVKQAKLLGAVTVATDYYKTGPAKEIADESADVSTVDFEGLKQLIKDRKIDGVFCGPGEFNIRNMIRLCEESGLRCYTDRETWEKCANKDVFKQYCREYGLDCAPEYNVSEESTDEELQSIPYPVIVKPVDNNSSTGITTCWNWTEVREACRFARANSSRGKIIVEKFIRNKGEIMAVKYLLKDGKAHLYLTQDTYVVDPDSSLICGFTFMPSHNLDRFLETTDHKIRAMFAGMGMKNGVAFVQILPCDGKFYAMEMAFRLSGGLIFKIAGPLCHVNDLQMMIRYALGEEICSDEEIRHIDYRCSGKVGSKLQVPLRAGVVNKIEGLEEILKIPCVKDLVQYYHEGDEVQKKAVGTLSQHFGRFTLLADDKEEVFDAVRSIQATLRVTDPEGGLMNDHAFDLDRVKANV